MIRRGRHRPFAAWHTLDNPGADRQSLNARVQLSR